jgi:hypothetical protein
MSVYQITVTSNVSRHGWLREFEVIASQFRRRGWLRERDDAESYRRRAVPSKGAGPRQQRSTQARKLPPPHPPMSMNPTSTFFAFSVRFDPLWVYPLRRCFVADCAEPPDGAHGEAVEAVRAGAAAGVQVARREAPVPSLFSLFWWLLGPSPGHVFWGTGTSLCDWRQESF